MPKKRQEIEKQREDRPPQSSTQRWRPRRSGLACAPPRTVGREHGEILFFVFFIVVKYGLLLFGHFSHVRVFVTAWTVAHQAPLSIGFSR